MTTSKKRSRKAATLLSPDAATETILDQLERVVDWSAGEFTLAFVKCNHPSQQKEMSAALLARLADKRVLEIELNESILSLLDGITARRDAANPPDAVCVYGLEKSINEQREASPVLGRLNNDRDLLRRSVPCPLLIWLPDFALDLVARGAPDFWAWRSGVYEFPTESSLFRADSAVALAPHVYALFSLALPDKRKEIARLEELLRTARALPRQSKREQQIVADLLYQIGLLHQSLSEWDNAARFYEQSLQIKQELGDKLDIAYTLYQLGMVQQEQDNSFEAVRHYEQSLQIRQELGDNLGIANTLHQLGNVQQEQGNLSEAARFYEQSLQIARELDDRNGIAVILHNIAMIEQEQGNLFEAMQFYEQSLQIKQELGDKFGIAHTLHQLGMVQQDQGNLSEAVQFYDKSLQLKQELGDKKGIAETLHQLGNVEYDQGNLTEALRFYEQSLQIEQELGSKSGIAISLGQIGRLQEEQGKLREALQYYMAAWMLFRELQSPYTKLVQQDIQEVGGTLGEEQFQTWLAEDFGKEAREIITALEESEAGSNGAPAG